MFDLVHHRFASFALLCGALVACTPSEQSPSQGGADDGTTYRLYLLAGQSNMEGYGDVGELAEGERGPVPGAVIYHPASAPDDDAFTPRASWQPLAPGFGSAYPPDGVTEGQFGPELGLGRALAETGPVALVKYARGGTALMHGVSGYGSWDPDYREGEGTNQFDHAVAALKAAMRAPDVDGDGTTDRLVPSGIVWMQGEADAYDNPDAAAKYQANLEQVVFGFRTVMGADNMPVVIGRIVDSRPPGGAPVMTYAAEVQEAQARFAAADPCVTLVTVLPTSAELSDGWHYGARNQLELGRAFAKALEELSGSCLDQ
jgi:hypothetical protein